MWGKATKGHSGSPGKKRLRHFTSRRAYAGTRRTFKRYFRVTADGVEAVSRTHRALKSMTEGLGLMQDATRRNGAGDRLPLARESPNPCEPA